MKAQKSNKYSNDNMTSCDIYHPEEAVSINKLKGTLFYLKANKIAECGDINSNIIKREYTIQIYFKYTVVTRF